MTRLNKLYVLFLAALNVYKCETHADCQQYNPRSTCGKVCVLPDTDDGDTGVSNTIVCN